MLPVRSPDLRGVRLFPAAADELGLQVTEEREDHGAQRLTVAERGRGVQDVRGGRPEVQERAHLFGEETLQHIDQGADVVLGLFLFRIDDLRVYRLCRRVQQGLGAPGLQHHRNRAPGGGVP